MKTKEELQSMSADALISYAQAIQDEIEKANKSADYWHQEYHKELARFISFRNAVKSVVELIEIPSYE